MPPRVLVSGPKPCGAIINDQFLLTIEIIDMLHPVIKQSPERCTSSNCFLILTFPKELPGEFFEFKIRVLNKMLHLT